MKTKIVKILKVHKTPYVLVPREMRDTLTDYAQISVKDGSMIVKPVSIKGVESQ